MQVNNVLVESLSWSDDRNEGAVRSILYQFSDPQWISIHDERQGIKLGPITLLADFEDDLSKLNHFSIKEFPGRPLPVELDRSMTFLTYHERWTIPPWTAYALVLPVGFAPVEVTLKDEQGSNIEPELRIASSPRGFLFYETVFSGDDRRIADVRVRVRKDPRQFTKLLEKPQVLVEQQRFESLRGNVCLREAPSAEFWFKLLDFSGSTTSQASAPNRVERFKQWCQVNPIVSFLIIIGVVLVALATLTDSIEKLRRFVAPSSTTNTNASPPGILNAQTNPPSATPGDDWNQGAHGTYRANLGAGKFNALLKAQEHNKGAYQSISSYGPDRTERFLKSIGQ